MSNDEVFSAFVKRQGHISRKIQPEGKHGVFLLYSILDIQYSIFKTPVE